MFESNGGSANAPCTETWVDDVEIGQVGVCVAQGLHGGRPCKEGSLISVGGTCTPECPSGSASAAEQIPCDVPGDVLVVECISHCRAEPPCVEGEEIRVGSRCTPVCPAGFGADAPSCEGKPLSYSCKLTKPPTEGVQNLQLQDVDPLQGWLTTTLTWDPLSEEEAAIAPLCVVRLGRSEEATWVPVGTYERSVPCGHGALQLSVDFQDATHVLVYTKNELGEQASPSFVRIDDAVTESAPKFVNQPAKELAAATTAAQQAAGDAKSAQAEANVSARAAGASGAAAERAAKQAETFRLQASVKAQAAADAAERSAGKAQNATVELGTAAAAAVEAKSAAAEAKSAAAEAKSAATEAKSAAKAAPASKDEIAAEQAEAPSEPQLGAVEAARNESKADDAALRAELESLVETRFAALAKDRGFLVHAEAVEGRGFLLRSEAPAVSGVAAGVGLALCSALLAAAWASVRKIPRYCSSRGGSAARSRSGSLVVAAAARCVEAAFFNTCPSEGSGDHEPESELRVIQTLRGGAAESAPEPDWQGAANPGYWILVVSCLVHDGETLYQLVKGLLPDLKCAPGIEKHYKSLRVFDADKADALAAIGKLYDAREFRKREVKCLWYPWVYDSPRSEYR